ncbi:hypothetical protein B0H13DRAFT_2286862 [Mycena leptocephala]|nr:hypothetical protein B0H13DRAFT_2286862 [Mycena leptocephala]
MGQYWMIVNFDKRQTYGSWGKLGEWFFDGKSPSYLETSLCQPKLPDRDVLISPFKPGEVCTYAHGDYPALYFPKTAPHSMTCQALWEIGRKHMYRHVAALAANCSWAGDRIMCIGDYLDNKDIPETLFTPAEREEFGPRLALRISFPDRQTDRRLSRATDPAQYFALQYVRESAVARIGCQVSGVGFGEVILSRICLSSDPSTNMASEGLSQGVWAGDRFDFVATEWLQELGDDAHWIDVSEEVVEEMEGSARLMSPDEK